eukprot:14112292-Ditylum_brightwellii.AAC.1
MESFRDWIESCWKSAPKQNGSVNVKEISNSNTAEQLWGKLKPSLSGCCDMMSRFFSFHGLKSEDITTFCRQYDTLQGLCTVYKEYCPRTFQHEEGKAQQIDNHNIYKEAVVDRMKRLVNMIDSDKDEFCDDSPMKKMKPTTK